MRGPRDRTYRGYLLRENPWLQLEGRQHQFRAFSLKALAAKSITVLIRANMVLCSRCNISLFLFEGRIFGLALRPARCEFVKDRAGIVSNRF